MIYAVNTASIPDSIGNEWKYKVMEWMKRLAKHIQSKWPEIEFELLTNYDGAQTEFHWKSKFASIAEAEKQREQWHQDDGIAALLLEATTSAKEMGSTPFWTNQQDHYYRIVDLD